MSLQRIRAGFLLPRQPEAAIHRSIVRVFYLVGLPRDLTRKVRILCKILIVRTKVPSGFLDQSVFDEADARRDDRAGDAAARQLPGHRANIEAAGAARRAAQGRDKPRQDCSANATAGGARDRFNEGAEINILKKTTGDIPANRPGDKLKNEIDDCSRHTLSP